MIGALKAEALLNESAGAGYIDRNWPPAFEDTGAWPLANNPLEVKRAKDLSAQGMTIAKIAKQLDTQPRVITRWLTKPK